MFIDFLIPIYDIDHLTYKMIESFSTEVPYDARFIFCLNGTYSKNQEIEEAVCKLEKYHTVKIIYEWPRIPVGYYRERLRQTSNAVWAAFVDSDDQVNQELFRNLNSILESETCECDVISFVTEEVPGEKIIMNSNTNVPFVVHAFYNRLAICTARFASVNRLDDMTFNLQLKRNGIKFKKRSETWILRGDNQNSISHEDITRNLPLDEIIQTLKIFLSTYDYNRANIRYVKNVSDFEANWSLIKRWLDSEYPKDLKVLIVDKSVMTSLPFIDMDTDTLLYQINFEENQELPSYLEIE